MTLVKRDNAAWLADLQAGDPAGEEALADLRALLIKGLQFGLRKYLSPGDPNFNPLVEEAVQDALLKIMDNLNTFRGESRFTTWAHKIALNVALTELRRKRWEDTSLDDLLEAEDGSIMTPSFMADPAQNPERTAVQRDLVHHVQRIIAEELTAKQRKAIIATRIRGVPMSEVAQRMDTTPNALYKLLHDARVSLKEKLAEEGLSVETILAIFEE